MGKASKKVMLAAAGAAAAVALPAWAATTGWNQTSPGAYAYNDTANWVDGTVNDAFDASLTLVADAGTVTGVQTLTFSSDYTPAGTMTFGFASPAPVATTIAGSSLSYGFLLVSDGVADRTLNIGNLTFTPTGADISAGQRKRVLTIGSATAGQKVNVNLGGATRTFNIGTTGTAGQDRGEGVTLLNVVSNGTITKTGAGWLRLGGTEANALTGLIVSAGIVRLEKSSGVAAVGGDITVTGGALLFLNTYQLSTATNLNISGGGAYLAGTSGTSSSGGAVSPATPAGQVLGNLTITGGTFNTGPRTTGSSGGAGNSTLTGMMNISGGTVAIRSRGTSFLANQIQLVGGSTGANISVQSGNGGTATFIIGTGGISITNRDSGAFTPISVGDAGALTLRGDVSYTGFAGNAETATITATAARSLSLDAGMRTFNIGDGDANVDLAINSNFTVSNGALTKSGAGTLQLDGPGSLTGGTTVSGGRLVVNNTYASAANVSGGVLAGTGTLSAGMSVNSGSVNPGSATAASLGTLAVGNTTIAGGTLMIDIGAAGASDVLAVAGNLDLSSLADALNVVGTADGSTYTIATYTGTLTGEFDTSTLPSGYDIDYGSLSNGVITISSVPEPVGVCMMGLAAGGLLGRRRRNRVVTSR